MEKEKQKRNTGVKEIEKTVKRSGNGAVIHVPKDWTGQRARAKLIENKR